MVALKSTVSAAPALGPDLGWTSCLRDLPREHGFEPMRLEGTLPAELTGTLYRTGPALFSSFGERYRHWFDGDGAVSAVRFGGGRARGAVKLVETQGLVAERTARRRLKGAYGTPAPGVKRFLPTGSKFKNAANTAVLLWNERLFALWEGGLPTELAPDDLATLGERDLGGVVGQSFSAHPHRVAARHASYNFGVRFGRVNVIDLYELPDAGPARKLGEVPLTHATMLHDFIATEKHLVFFAPPLALQPLRLLFGLDTLADLTWAPARGTEVIVVPIDEPTRVTRFTIEPFYQWHFANAFERGGELVVDVVRYPDFDSNRWFGKLVQGQVATTAPVAAGTLWRVTLDVVARSARSEERWPVHCEFPRVAPSVEGAPYGVTWMAATATGGRVLERLPDSIVRVDVETGASRRWTSAGNLVSEPVFVPRPGGQGEDDGWLLVLDYDASADKSNVAVLDARDPSRGPLAKAWFDHHVPPTFHGGFAG